MGIISTLLTGGSILGKVCQMISDSGIVNSMNCKDGSRLTVKVAKTEINGVRFTEVVKDGKIMLHALNTDVDMYAVVTYPNGYGKTEGFQTFIPPMENTDLELGEWDLLSPELPIYVQKIDLSDGADIENDRVIVAFRNLSLDGTTLEMPNTTITATMDTVKITFATASLDNLASAEFISENGVRATLRDPIQVINGELTETSYKIPFGDLGFTEDDVLSGIMQFNITTENAQLIKSMADNICKRNSINGSDEVNMLLLKTCGLAKK